MLSLRGDPVIFNFTVQQMLEVFDNDKSLFKEVFDLFFDNLSVEYLNPLRASAAAGDSDGVLKGLHKIKGALQNFSARPLIARIETLETEIPSNLNSSEKEELNLELDALEGHLTSLKNYILRLEVIKE